MNSKNLFYVEKEALRPSENLAINSYLAEQVEKKSFDTIVRFYKHEPGIILGANESVSDVYKKNSEKLGFEIARRPTGGSAVIVDENTLCYSIFSRKEKTFDVHEIYKSIVLPLCEELGENFSVEGTYYLRHKGSPIAGHSLKTYDNCVQFDGIVNTASIDTNLVSNLIKLRDLYESNGENYVSVGGIFYDLKGKNVQPENPVFVKSEKKALEELVGLKDIGLNEEGFIQSLYKSMLKQTPSLTKVEKVEYDDEEIEKRKRSLEENLQDNSRKMKNLGHCFIDMIEKEEAL